MTLKSRGLTLAGAVALAFALVGCSDEVATDLSPDGVQAAATEIPDQYIVAFNRPEGGLLATAAW